MLDIDPVHYPGDDKCAIDKKLEATVLGPTCSEEAVEGDGSSAFLVSVVPAETAPFDEAELVIEIDTALLQEGDYYFPATGLDDCYAELQLCTQVDYIYTVRGDSVTYVPSNLLVACK